MIQDEKTTNKKTTIQQVLKNNKTTTKQELTLGNMKAPTRAGNWTERREIKQQKKTQQKQTAQQQ